MIRIVLNATSEGISPTIPSAYCDQVAKHILVYDNGYSAIGVAELQLNIDDHMEQDKNWCVVEDAEGNKYRLRIRKLTPKECARFMDVSDEDADKMLAVNSKSQCYKQYGNSIVVACMTEIFRNLFINPEKEIEVMRCKQLTIF